MKLGNLVSPPRPHHPIATPQGGTTQFLGPWNAEMLCSRLRDKAQLRILLSIRHIWPFPCRTTLAIS